MITDVLILVIGLIILVGVHVSIETAHIIPNARTISVCGLACARSSNSWRIVARVPSGAAVRPAVHRHEEVRQVDGREEVRCRQIAAVDEVQLDVGCMTVVQTDWRTRHTG
jgi:hypothetical protein